ncbi:hypothetical protein SAM23877_0319 [Streptomyces ambofaciens ATCC 23877]|uniref:Uncharacterized protein n=1 Tax=Streptomyces ambofaciens (strain ATCC 23877 / 3486 / DSM 40053 / JCM 4204 / NBRC 12836 / NRRL B-2516) TaxID=278992 RepID=A0A0K2AK26_STRA7|nr:hypothetical protein SAM23877_0319 [Streptomyces ambofaciens ATCC 23877]
MISHRVRQTWPLQHPMPLRACGLRSVARGYGPAPYLRGRQSPWPDGGTPGRVDVLGECAADIFEDRDRPDAGGLACVRLPVAARQTPLSPSPGEGEPLGWATTAWAGARTASPCTE